MLSAEAVTAQDDYRVMIRNHVAPALRELGFKGSGQNYVLPSEKHWVSLRFQKSVYSDADRIDFTVHLLVVGKDEWDAIRRGNELAPERPHGFWGAPARSWTASYRPRPKEVPGGWMQLWWELYAGQPIEPLADLVLRAIKNEALPRIEEYMAWPSADV
jgi:uncharacterized protein DUF4304